MPLHAGRRKMAALVKAVQLSKTVNNVKKLLTNLSLSPSVSLPSSPAFVRRVPQLQCALFHTTPVQNDLMEFFDDKKNWGKTEIRVGRSWRKDELRLKSNEDLHKLWYVLLKERNMLLTMEDAHKAEFVAFPNPERVDKVEESMCNIEEVVRERNRAYHLLETGENGERPAKLTYNALGMRFYYRMRQYAIPKFMNKSWHKKHMFGFNGYAVRKFLRLYREKINGQRFRRMRYEERRVLTLLSRYPNLDIEALRQKYPSVDIDKLQESDRARGHRVPD